MTSPATASPADRDFKRALLIIIVLLVGYSLAESLITYFILEKSPGDTAAKEVWSFIDGLQEPGFYLIALLTIARGKLAERYGAAALAALLAFGGAQTLYGLARQLLGWDPPVNFSMAMRLYGTFSAIISSIIVLAILWRFRKSMNPVVMAAFLASQVEAIATPLRMAAGWAGRIFFDIRWPWQVGRLIGGLLLLWAAWKVLNEMLKEQRAAEAVAPSSESPHKSPS